ncbi:predicted protein [Histoplasma capsulatum G186AR]|uniref:Uncharacterized protein n=1 Tax=Ajellomyces capsulatus (strain G186AR / H82 / ATCC MYA-2454 / RMSCC 2432) TaxID=447093 RepID=C0NHS4_AJECG|nr:uncharacterized protein HCBG_02896 [Histoplasma capsulatum G186AR]EEH09359.1 predicted protein [Histoplasma capsulatum G186AR]
MAEAQWAATSILGQSVENLAALKHHCQTLAVEPLNSCKPKNLKEIKRLSRRGGPDLSDLGTPLITKAPSTTAYNRNFSNIWLITVSIPLDKSTLMARNQQNQIIGLSSMNDLWNSELPSASHSEIKPLAK